MESLKKFVNSVEPNADTSSNDLRRPGSGMSGVSEISSNGTANSTLFSQAAFSQRIVNVEHYMTVPVKEFDNLYSEFRNSAVKKVPIIRIFGSTPAGQKVCANIHGVYPYISILDDDTIEGLEHRIAGALDNAINDSVSTKTYWKGDQSNRKAVSQHVFKVIRVLGKTFYGYRPCNEVFLRIFFYNPLMLKKAVDLLQSGSVLSRRFQPYEAHIPYTLQFMIDYCLYGMNYIHYSALKFRRNSTESVSSKCSEDLLQSMSQTSNSSIPGYVDPTNIDDSRLGPKELSKLTRCELEIDVLASDIILESKVSEKAVSVNPGIDSIWKDEIERRRLHGVENCSQITVPESQERTQAPARLSAEERYRETLMRKLESFFEYTAENDNEESQNASYLNGSIMDDDELIPSSQVLNHLSEESLSQNHSSTSNKLSQDEDEFMKLLEKMIEVDVSQSSQHENEVQEDPFGNKIVDEKHFEELPDNEENDEEGLWEDSFINSSILETISDTDNACDSDLPSEQNPPDPSLAIFQCDGQGGDSDTNSDNNSHLQRSNKSAKEVKTLRSSRRMSEIKPKNPGSSSNKAANDSQPKRMGKESRISTSHSNSPNTNRLSLTLRRKSRSQETMKAKPQESDLGKPSRKSVHRRSRSASADKDTERHHKKEKPIEVERKTKKEINVSEVSRPVTRKSLSTTHSILDNKPRKGKSGIAKVNVQSTSTDDKKSKKLEKNSTSDLNEATKSKILSNKVARICLTKIDTDPTVAVLPKRPIRRPRRYQEEKYASESNLATQSSVISNEESKTDDMQTEEQVNQVSAGLSEDKSSLKKRRKGTSVITENSAVVESKSSEVVENKEVVKQKKRKKKGCVQGTDNLEKNCKLTDAEEDGNVEVLSRTIKLNNPPKTKSKVDSKKQVSDVQENESNNQVIANGSHGEAVNQKVEANITANSVETESELKAEDNSHFLTSTKNPKSEGEVKVTNVRQLKKTIKKRKLSEIAKIKINSEAIETYSESKNSVQSDDASKISEEKKDGETKSVSKDNSNALDKTKSDTQNQIGNVEDSSVEHSEGRSETGFDTHAEPNAHVPENQTIKKKKKKRLGMGLSKIVKPTISDDSPSLTQTEDHKNECAVNTVDVVQNAKMPSFRKVLPENTSNVTLSEKKQFLDAEVTCKPENKSVLLQTPPVENKDIGISAKPSTEENGSQIQIASTSSETQTYTKKMVSIETQTDAIAPLCLCQCTCVIKEKADASTDNQDELKPVMESKRIQVDNVDMITRARSARFTTPQGNKIKRTTTPSKSPEKRKSLPESPSRRQMTNTTSSHSRYLSALIKTPTSHHKYRSFGRASPSTPKSANCSQFINVTPPSRESREDYLVNAIRAASHSPRKRTSFIRPRNLDIETANMNVQANEAVGEPIPPTLPSPSPLVPSEDNDNVSTPNSDEMLVAMESDNIDLSVNSIYEYEEPSPKVEPLPLENNGDRSPASISSFQRKRIQSKHRSKNRLEKKRAANMDANRGIFDIFEVEYEPLKQPASFKSTIKWLEAEKNRVHVASINSPEKSQSVISGGDSSDEECLPPPVKLFGGGNMSDDENSDSEDHSGSNRTAERHRESIKPFTPPIIHLSTASIHESPPDNCNNNSNETPRSILRPSGSARRNNARVLKRKIRWEDEEPCSKRIKTEWGNFVVKEEVDESSQSSLANGTLDKTMDTSELDGLSFKNALGLENSMSNFHDVKALHQCQFLTTMYIEIHCSSRNNLLPDPTVDPVLAIFVLISNDHPDGFRKPKECLNLLLLDDKATTVDSTEDELGQKIKACSSEGDLIESFISLVRQWDPDIFVGYEIEKSSLGYLIQRGQCFGKDLLQELSRVLPVVIKPGMKNFAFREKQEWNGTIGGRIVLNLWRLLRHEITVQSYTFENAAYHILLRRVCKFSQKTLREYWSHKMHRYKVIQYYTIRVKGSMQILEKLDLINRTSELARLFGIQFYEVLSRGSQFRVESMMLRATKPLDLIAPSPTVMQRAKMRAPEYLPLILEPRSNYYTDPVAVLDFQSLYPSMMIAYNYDYASLLGRVDHLGNLERFPMGCLDHGVSPADLLRLKEHIHVSPAGVAFVDKSVIKGVLPEMLEQILDTRQMVKRAMKKWKNEGASLHKVLDSRQLGLKLIANVTYGYTSANFSGRMPCVEIADSIVSKGRETLQRAINHVKENYGRWGAEVVYGDTDSMFILFRGKSKEEAFKLAYEIADEVTQANPKPVKLKFEKIYQPCILQTKKRYVGYAYETPDQTKPIYDAKGIETVRRDGCPAVKKILEKTLHVLFSSNKPEKVEHYVKSQFEKLFKGRVSMQDYIFAREYRGRAGYKPKASVPSLEIAKRLTQSDPRAEPLVSERVPYVVVYGDPNLPLIKLVRTPQEYLESSGLRLNAHYYIEKAIIPALNRCLSHAGINPMKWYLELPRKFLRNVLGQKTKGQGTLDDYILHQNCLRCEEKAEQGLCNNCLTDGTGSIIYLQEVLRNAKSKLNSCIEICMNCAGETDRCVSIDCPVLHKLTRYQRDQAHLKKIERELVKLEW